MILSCALSCSYKSNKKRKEKKKKKNIDNDLAILPSHDKKGFVNRLDLTAPNDYDYICTSCAYGKSHRKPMPGTSNTKYSKMELIVMDLTGPILVPTWDGYVYAPIIVEVSC